MSIYSSPASSVGRLLNTKQPNPLVPVAPKPTLAPAPVPRPAPVLAPAVPAPVVPAPGSAAAITPRDTFSYAPTPDDLAAEKARARVLAINGADANAVVDPEKEYRAKLKTYQAQIDATNAVYNDQLNASRVAGQGRLGSSRASQGRSGLLGSDFGAAQTDTITTANQEADQAVQNERSVAINSILGLAQKDALDSVATKTAAKKAGADALLKYYSEDVPAQKTARLSKVAKALFDKKLDPTTLTPAELKQLSTDWKVSSDDITSAYTEYKTTKDTEAADTARKTAKEQADIDKINADIASGKLINLGEGNKLYNTETREVVAYNPKTYAPKDPTPTYGGYTEDQNKVITRIDDKVSKNATYAKTSNMRGYVDNVNASLGQQTGTGDLAAINQFQKVIDEGAVTRDQDVKLIQGSQSLANRLATYSKKLQNGEQLSPALRSEMKTAVNSLYEAQVKALGKDPFITSKKAEVERYGVRLEDTILGELGAFNSNGAPPEASGDPEYDAYLQSIGQ